MSNYLKKGTAIFLIVIVSMIIIAECLAENDLSKDIKKFFSAGGRKTSSIMDKAEFDEYYFVVIRTDDGTNTLYGFKRVGNSWNYWLKSSAAMYQHVDDKTIILSNATGNNEMQMDITHTQPTLSIVLSNGEYYEKCISYTLFDGIWQIVSYWSNGGGNSFSIYFDDNKVTYYSSIEERKPNGSVSATIQRDLRYVSLPTIPTTLEDAKNKLTSAPTLPESAELVAQNVKFTGGLKYDVYSGPSRESYRSANGKASVSSNGWIQVFGEEEDWILIQYSIDSSHYRFGYIEADSLPENTKIKSLEFEPTAATTVFSVSLTDDPLYSQEAMVILPESSQLQWLATIGEWAYVETTTGTWMRGFIPVAALEVEIY